MLRVRHTTALTGALESGIKKKRFQIVLQANITKLCGQCGLSDILSLKKTDFGNEKESKMNVGFIKIKYKRKIDLR